MESRKYLGRYFLEWANRWYEDGLLNDCSRVEELKDFIPPLARPGFANIELGLLEHLAEHVCAKGVDIISDTGPRVGSDAIRAAYIQGQAGTASRLKVVSRLGALENNVVFTKTHKSGSREFLTRYFLAKVSSRVREMMLVIGGRLWAGIEENQAAASNTSTMWRFKGQNPECFGTLPEVKEGVTSIGPPGTAAQSAEMLAFLEEFFENQKSETVVSFRSSMVAPVCDLVVDSLHQGHFVSLAEVAEQLNMSGSNLSRRLAAESFSFSRLRRLMSMSEGAIRLNEGSSVLEVSDSLGLKNQSTFSRMFASQFRLSPRHFVSLLDRSSKGPSYLV